MFIRIGFCKRVEIFARRQGIKGIKRTEHLQKQMVDALFPRSRCITADGIYLFLLSRLFSYT